MAYEAGLVPCGRLGDNCGRKAVGRLGLGGFVTASAACAVGLIQPLRSWPGLPMVYLRRS